MPKVIEQSSPVCGIFTSDWHLDDKPSITRSVEINWWEVQKGYIDQLRMLQDTHHCPIFVAGDLLNRWNLPAYFITQIIVWLRGMQVVCIPGNHDIPHHNYGTLDRSAYWTLVEAGAITHLAKGGSHSFKEVTIHPFAYSVPISPCHLKDGICLQVALIHDYIWTEKTGHKDAPKEQRYGAWIKKLEGYDVACFGDNHLGFTIAGVDGKPTIHNCILPGNYVTGVVEAASKSFYSGQAIELTTSLGLSIRTTANHPILTEAGFIPASLIHEGQYVLCGERKINEFCLQGKKNTPTLIENVFRAIKQNVSIDTWSRLPATTVDLHGDGKFIKGNIEIVSSQRKLTLHTNPKYAKSVNNTMLNRSGVCTFNVPSSSPSHFDFLRIFGSSPRLLAILRLLSSFLFSHPRPNQFTSLRLGTTFKPCFSESIIEGTLRTTDTDCYATNRLPSLVTKDQIIQVRKFDWRGHVYDLQTSDGLILAQTNPNGKGIYISNCGTLLRRHSDEIKFNPRVGLLHTSGEMKLHMLDTSEDKFLQLNEEVGRLEKALEVELANFAKDLAEQHYERLDYAKTVLRWVKKENVPDMVKEVILRCLKGSNRGKQ